MRERIPLQNRLRYPVLGLSLVALLWAGNFPASKIGLTELGPVTLTAVRAVLVTPVLILLARLLHGPFPSLRRSDYTTFVVLSLTGLVGNTTIWFWGMKYTSPINAGILGAERTTKVV